MQNSRHIQNPVKYLRWKILFATLCNPSIFRAMTYSESKAYSHIYILCIYVHMYLYIYIKAYSEYMAYSGIFRTVDIFSQFQACYSGIAQEQCMHILNLIQADSDILRALAFLTRNVSRIFKHIQHPRICHKAIVYAKQKIFRPGTKMSYLFNFGL